MPPAIVKAVSIYNTHYSKLEKQNLRYPFALILGFATFYPSSINRLFQESLSSAYISVGSFVAVSLLVLYLIEKLPIFSNNLTLVKYRHLHIPLAALLGIIPGCGGAIIVMTRYLNGGLSFGSLLAVMIATMGDAAFVLINREPTSGLAVFGISFIVGIISGYIADYLLGKDYLQPNYNENNIANEPLVNPWELSPHLRFTWCIMLIPAIFLGVCVSVLNMTEIEIFGQYAKYHPALIIGLIGGSLGIFMWCISPNHQDFNIQVNNIGILEKTMFFTNFVTYGYLLGF